MIPISSVELGPEVEARVIDVLRSGIIAQGPVVAEFERSFADLLGVRHAIAVNNGTTALVAAVEALGLGPGDEIVTSPFTFVATVNAILESGASVRFADISPDDFCVDPDRVAEAVTDRTRAIMPVHLYGQSADMAPIVALAESAGLSLIEDAAQAHGATYRGTPVGGFGVGCFSFYATKNLTTGEGGIITTASDELAEKLRILRNQGMRARYEYVTAGHNYRMTDLQAAVVLPQLSRYGAQLEARRANAARLNELLADVEGLVLPRELEGRTHVWHQYTVLLPSGADRDAVVAGLAARGVTAGVYYPRLINEYDAYAAHPRVDQSDAPVARDVASRCLSLPVHPRLSPEDLETIASSLRAVLA